MKNRSRFLSKPYSGLIKLICCGLVLLVLPVSIVQGQTKTVSEYQVKAVFLFNFTQFIDWPERTFYSSKDPFVIGIIGENPFASHLSETVSGEKYGTHPIMIKYYRAPEEIVNCHMLYINSDDQKEIEKVLTSNAKKNILTVSDLPDFTRKGGMIQFYIEDNKIRLRINVERSKAAGLTISSKLLKLAATN